MGITGEATERDGVIIELTTTEHSRILHRYNRINSDIADRNGNFKSFR